ncbi:unnamed protein product [Allacma fusca]|uniref:Uncharacterized protein n=1 Tax=Allacma fusca TaxID=39272 RepID=A0A8J2LLE7_9HEXA|nr:unnamed protein product [Allacma fusca]
MNFRKIRVTLFFFLFALSLAASQSYRNGTICKTSTYKRQINYNETTSGDGTTESSPGPTITERKLISIESQGKINSAKLEVVLQVLAETQRSLLFIERKIREHDEANTVVTQQLKQKIQTLEERLQNGGSDHISDSHNQPPEDAPEIDTTTRRPVVFDDPPFIRRRYSPDRQMMANIQATAEALTAAQNETEGSEESEENTATTTTTTTTTAKPPKETKKVKKIKNVKTLDRRMNAASQLNNISIVTLDLLMRHPRARLYTEDDFHGQYTDYHSDYSAERGCSNLGDLAGRIKSVDSYTTCVRVFLDNDCQGWSQAIYDGGNQSKAQVLNSKLTAIRSIGRCVQDEFTNAESVVIQVNPGVFKDVVSKEKAQSFNLFYIPDLIEFRSDDKAHNSIRVRDKAHLVTNYLRGYGGRLEFSESMVSKEHLRSLEDLEALTRQGGGSSSSESSSESNEGKDDAGFALPLHLGGSIDEKYNLFPQSAKSLNEWNDKLKWIPSYLEKYPSSWVSISVNLAYANETAMRPIAFAYYIDKFNKQIMYGYIEN